MKTNLLAATALLISPWLLMPTGHAAESGVAATATMQGMPAGEHSGHDHAGMTGTGTMPRANGAGKRQSWTAFPTLKTRMSGENRESRVITVIPQNIVANSIEAYSNNPEDANGRRQLALDMTGARLDKPESGGFHWLAAREEMDGQVRVASTVHYFGERGGQNPTAMFMGQKHELEFIPQPFPREHSRYRANEDWKFLVRFNSQPLANQKVLLETANGTRTELASDTQGVVMVRIPDDFKEETQQKPAGNHDHRRRSADFVLATEHAADGKNYLTAFNGSYSPDAFDQRSLAMGLGFTLMGMIGAAPLLRQRKDKKKQAAATQNKKEA